MSDLRKFNQTSTPSMVPEPIRDTSLNSDVQNKSGLSNFHHIDDSGEGSNTGRIAGALVVALLIGGAGVYAYSSYSPSPKAQVADNNLQSPSVPKNVVAAAPPSSVQTAPAPQPADNSALQNSPYAGAPAAAPAPTSNDVAPASTEKPVKPIRSHIARADKTNEAQENMAEASQTAQLNRGRSGHAEWLRAGAAAPSAQPPRFFGREQQSRWRDVIG